MNLCTDHVFFVQNLGVPPWPCPLCGCPGAARHPYAESSDHHEQELQDLQAHLLGISREVNDVFGGPPGVVMGPPIAGSILPTGTTQQPQDFAFNPLTAIHGEFVPGEIWRYKAIELNSVTSRA